MVTAVALGAKTATTTAVAAFVVATVAVAVIVAVTLVRFLACLVVYLLISRLLALLVCCLDRWLSLLDRVVARVPPATKAGADAQRGFEAKEQLQLQRHRRYGH